VKKPWERPELSRYGDLRRITAATKSAGSGDGSGTVGGSKPGNS